MRTRYGVCAAVLTALAAVCSSVAFAADEVKFDPAAAVQKFLAAKFEGQKYQPVALDDDALQTAFRDHKFLLLRFAQYPVGRMVPEGLGVSNLFAVNTLGAEKVTLMTNAKDVQEFCAATLVAKDEKTARSAAHGYATLRKELSQDGFFKFKIEPDKFEVAVKPGEITVKLKIEVDSGQKPGPGMRSKFQNSGQIECTVAFKGETGAFSVVEEKEDLKTGMRPICQSLKLRDKDPAVRANAEHDLLIMGVNALPYLREKAGETQGDLRQAILDLIKRIESGEGGEHMPGGQPAAK